MTSFCLCFGLKVLSISDPSVFNDCYSEDSNCSKLSSEIADNFLSFTDEHGKEKLNVHCSLYSSLAICHGGYLQGHAVFFPSC